VRRRGAVFALVLAIAFGVMGSAMAYIYLTQQSRRTASGAEANLVPVVVAAADLTFGTTIRSEHVNTVMYPEASVPVGAFHDPDSLVGQTTKVFVTTREPVLATKLSSMGGGLSIRIPLTMRATSMNVNVVSGVSGFVLPGDRVDVLVVIDRPGQAGTAITRTILQNVEVLAAGVGAARREAAPGAQESGRHPDRERAVVQHQRSAGGPPAGGGEAQAKGPVSPAARGDQAPGSQHQGQGDPWHEGR
jgi:pilus assembly protein CpaB